MLMSLDLDLVCLLVVGYRLGGVDSLPALAQRGSQPGMGGRTDEVRRELLGWPP